MQQQCVVAHIGKGFPKVSVGFVVSECGVNPMKDRILEAANRIGSDVSFDILPVYIPLVGVDLDAIVADCTAAAQDTIM